MLHSRQEYGALYRPRPGKRKKVVSTSTFRILKDLQLEVLRAVTQVRRKAQKGTLGAAADASSSLGTIKNNDKNAMWTQDHQPKSPVGSDRSAFTGLSRHCPQCFHISYPSVIETTAMLGHC